MYPGDCLDVLKIPSNVGILKGLTGLQITVGHWTMADQNLPMSDEISTVVGHNVWTFFFCLPTQTHKMFCSKRKLAVTTC